MRHHKNTREPAAERGNIILSVAVLLVIIGGVTLAFLEEGVAEHRSVGHFEDNLQAMEIAETGLARSELELKSQIDYDSDGLGAVSGTIGGGAYEVTARPDPTATMEWIVTASGRKQLSLRRIEVRARVRPRGLFTRGLFAKSGMVLNGDIATDAYDSRNGTYDSQAVNLDASGKYALSGGHVGSNTTIRVLGSGAVVRGDAIPGPYDFLDASGQPTIWGSTTPLDVEIDLPNTPYSEFEAAWTTNDNASIPAAFFNSKTGGLEGKSSEVITLEGGTYFFTSISIGAQASLVVKGPSKIYVTGPANLSGQGVVNPSGIPSNFQLYAHPYPLPPGKIQEKGQVTLVGGSEAYMAVYAPDRPVVINGGSDLYGAVVGGEVTVGGNPKFHYDKALDDIRTLPGYTIQRLSWRELSSPPR